MVQGGKRVECNEELIIETSEKLSLAKPQRRKDYVFESFCNFAFLREISFWDY